MADPPILKRSLSLTLLTLYGLGNILGAGVYVLIGKVAGEAGYFAPFAFLLASLIAMLTALSFAELSARFPVSAGPAAYVQEGFGMASLSLVVGLLIVATGIVSAATIARGFVGYLGVFLSLPEFWVIIALMVVLGLVAAWGILESVTLAALFTVLEISGLLLILLVAAPGFVELPARAGSFIPPPEFHAWSGIVAGAFLAFYAFVGFEDMANVAEEVKNPRRALPIAMLLCVTCATVLYVLLALAAQLLMTPAELGASDAPLSDIYRRATGNDPWFISSVSLFAVVNGGLIQIIMASRMLYGLAQQQWLPDWIGRVNARTQTPVNATIIITVCIIIGALWLPIETLARSTTTMLLIVFTLVNFALLRMKWRGRKAKLTPAGNAIDLPLFLPAIAAILCLLFLLSQLSAFSGAVTH